MVTPALAGRHIVLGVCGGIAAYKAIEVCRRLSDAGARVTPVLTRAATRFVGEMTFSALAAERTRTSLWEGPEVIPHTRLGQSADLILVVPATARLIGTYAAGISSDLLTATLLATRAPVLIAPAMHTEMWEHPAVTENLDTLRRRGVHVVEPGAGRLAGGDIGAGRLADPAAIVAAAAALLEGPPDAAVPSRAVPSVAVPSGAVPSVAVPSGAVPSVAVPSGAAGSDPGSLGGTRAVVSAGGTREPIDAVRFIGNRSSGKQGHAVAAELSARGAGVTLVRTVDLPVAPGIDVVQVETAAEMEAAVMANSAGADIVVMAAAVADFRPKAAAAHKLKKVDGAPDLVLEPVPDILAALGASRRPEQVLVGFAAETASVDPDTSAPGEARQRLVAYARAKLAGKVADLVVANDVSAPDVGFAHDTNAVVIVGSDGSATDIGLRGKDEVAAAIVDAIVALRAARGAALPGHPRDTGRANIPQPPKERL